MIAMLNASPGAPSPTVPLIPASVQTAIPTGPDGPSRAVARMVGGILSYTRWPTRPQPVRLCIAGATRHAAALGALPGTLLRAVPPGGAPADLGCNALFLGILPATERARLIAAARGEPIATIDQADPGCRSGAMFCLHLQPERIAFELNLDAVSRSGVRIDPKVLLLSRRSATP